MALKILPTSNMMKTKLKNFFKNHYFHILICATLTVIAAIVLFPYLKADRHSGHDLKYHFSVIRSLSIAWDKGSFGNKLMELIGGDYGYGTGIFYSTFPAALCVIFIKLFHMSQTAALFLEMLLLFSLSAITLYFFLHRVFKRAWIAGICAASYLVYPYFLWDLYVRFAFTEIFLMLAMPLIVWGVYELLYRQNHLAFYILFILGFTIAIFSHFTMTVYIAIFIGIWLLIEWKKTFHVKTLLAFAIASGITLLICASYYLPMLVNYGVTDTSSMSKTAEQIKTNTLKYYTETILTLDFTYISLIYLLYVVYYIFFAQNKRTNGKTAILLLSALILYIYNPIFPWKIMPNFLRMIQYTFRILLFAGITTPLIIGILLHEFFCKKQTEEQAETVEVRPLPSAIKKVQSPALAKAIEKVVLFFNKKMLCKIGKILCQILLIGSFVFCGIFAYQHNAAMPKSLYNNASSTTFGNDALETLTGHSEFYGLGAGKHGDYFPTNCKRDYLSSRLKPYLLHSYKMSISELAIYDDLSQISFLAQKTSSSYVILKIPYSVFDGAEVYRFSTKSNNQALEITPSKAENSDRVRLDVADFGNESKIIISYKNAPALKEYLEKNALGAVVLDGNVHVSNLQKQRAGKYSLDVQVTENGGILELPSLYYKGYRITLVDEHGKKHHVQPIHGRNGFIEVELQQSGTLHVSFTSAYLVISYVISAVGYLAFAGIVAYCLYQKKKALLS